MYIFGHISVKQRQFSDQQVDSGPWVVQQCKNINGLYSPLGDTLTPATSGLFSVNNTKIVCTFGGHFKYLQDNTLVNTFISTYPIVFFYTKHSSVDTNNFIMACWKDSMHWS